MQLSTKYVVERDGDKYVLYCLLTVPLYNVMALLKWGRIIGKDFVCSGSKEYCLKIREEIRLISYLL
jgi:hypothetical protein